MQMLCLPMASHHEAQKSNAKEGVDVLPEAVPLSSSYSDWKWFSSLHMSSEELRTAYVISYKSCPQNIPQPENITQSKCRLALLCHSITSQHMRERGTREIRQNF